MNRQEKSAQAAIVHRWEKVLSIPDKTYAAKILGISWFTYDRYRRGLKPLPVPIQYAMQALVYGLAPWGTE